MIRAPQYEIMGVLEDIRRLSFDARFGQLLANLGLLAEDRTGRSLWDIEDVDLLKIMEEHRADLLRRDGGEGVARSEFSRRLLAATGMVLEHSRRLVSNTLPSDVRYVTSRNPGEVLDAEQLIDQLYVHGAVPVWIDLGLHHLDERFSYLDVSYSSRRTRDERQMRYKDQGLPPFQIGGLYVPTEWERVRLERQGKIALRLRETSGGEDADRGGHDENPAR
jgi:hypothetical protein